MTLESDINHESVGRGLLPHEAAFITAALHTAMLKQRMANDAYQEAVDNSGGDWALDDPTSIDAALTAHISDRNTLVYERINRGYQKHGTENYPDPDQDTITYGSRVVVDYGDDDVETLDIGTRNIPGMPDSSGAETISADSALGRSLFGAKIGDTINWETGDGRKFSLTVVGLDQKAVAISHNFLAEDK